MRVCCMNLRIAAAVFPCYELYSATKDAGQGKGQKRQNCDLIIFLAVVGDWTLWDYQSDLEYPFHENFRRFSVLDCAKVNPWHRIRFLETPMDFIMMHT